jgi:glycosyltransferase involved in cell wall biosynthesis
VNQKIHILHTERYLHNPTLIESRAVRESFQLSKSCRINQHAGLIYTQTYAASDILHVLRHSDKPYVVHMGGDIWYELNEDQHRLKLVDTALKRATLVVANSAFLYQILCSHGLKNAMFLPGGLWGFDESVHGVMPERFEPKAKHADVPKRYLMAISLKVAKKFLGIELFMKKAFKYLHSTGAEVICAGKIANKHFAVRMEREYEVQFVGQRADWTEYLPQADVFLHPSLFDCFPRALAEAKCAGLPCVSFSTAGNVEVGDSPIYVDPNDEGEIVSALKAVQDRGLREYLGWMGRNSAMKKTEAYRYDYPTIFKTLLKEGPGKLIQSSKEALS